MWLDLIIVMSSAVGAFFFGRVYSSIDGYTVQSVITDPDSDIDDKRPKLPNRKKVNEVAQRLKEHAESMAASVDAHQSKMQAVNNSLIENEQATAEDVLGVVNELIEANKTMQRQLNDAQNRIHEQSMELESAELRAQTDSLTRIPNRRAFDMQMAEQLDKGKSQESTLVLLDVDHFKKFNDHYGHLAGDEVLRVVAGLIHSRLNQYGMVARYGGEEFAIIFDGTPASDVKRLVEQTRIAIAHRETEFENKSLCVTASFGIAQFSGEETVDQWIQRADAGLYVSKETGRNCTHWMNGIDPILVNDDERAGASNAPAREENGSDTSILDSYGRDQPIETEELPEAFADLKGQAELSHEFSTNLDRMQSGISVIVMAIRNHNNADELSISSLLPVVRSTLRTVDRIGYANSSTLLVCMPSVSEEVAIERGTQICRSAATIGMATGSDCKRPVTIGIAKANGDERFNLAVTRAIGLADEGLDEEKDAVCTESQQVSAV